MQRVLWIAFLICLWWTLLALVAGLPLYIVDTPCISQTGPQVQFGGQLSTLQDLSLLRVLFLLDNRNIITTPADIKFISREIFNGVDRTPNVRIRLIVLTVLVIVLGILPMAWKLHKEFNKLLRHRHLWLSAKCDSLDLGWLSISKVPGFRGWGEQRLKDFFHKNGLGSTLIQSSPRSNADNIPDKDHNKLSVDVTGVFTIVNTSALRQLVGERVQILDRLEEAETRYIASFRLTTPEPSLAEELPHIPESKPYISRPRMLAGSMKAVQPERRQGTGGQSIAPSSYVAPSPYYRLREPKYQHHGDPINQNPLGRSIHEHLTGSRFREVNRDSSLYDPIPLGSALQVGETGDLEPIPEDGSQPTTTRADWGPRSQLLPTHTPDLQNPVQVTSQEIGLSVLSDRESFPMRPMQRRGPDPPHLRTQTDRPFVRPLSGVDNESLSLIYDDVRHWRSRLKAINNEIANAQQDAYMNISEGVNVTGWLFVGRNLRFLPGVEIIEGRSKSDIRWDQLQTPAAEYRLLPFWTTVAFVGILLGAVLAAVTGLALSNAPAVSHFLAFLQPLAVNGSIGASLGITLVPAVLLTLCVVFALCFVNAAAKYSSSVSTSGSQLYAFKATFYLLTFVAAIWVVAVGSVLFAIGAFAEGSSRADTVAHGSIYVAAFILALIINAAIISPALLLLQPRRAWKVWRNERAAITPRQRFRAFYPRPYNPMMTIGCGTLAVIFAAIFAVIFPLIGPAVVLLLFLTLIAHRYLVGYAYGRGGVGEQGGLLQIWLVRRFASIMSLQPILLGLIFLSRSLWVMGGILTGVGTFLLISAEVYVMLRTHSADRKQLPNATLQSLTLFQHIASNQRSNSDGETKSSSNVDEQASLASRERLSQLRSRGSLASVLEMMSITLATIPSRSRNRLPVPLDTEDLDDLTATDRAARTHPSAPPHLPPLPFEDRAKETSEMLYAPEMLAEPPAVWLPNDSNGIALAEAYDLQRYHDLAVVLDVHQYQDASRIQR